VTAPALHRRIRADIEGRIVSGVWPPGHAVPSEHELMGFYGCSRMTVNKALTALAGEGIITRRRRAGSVVAQPVNDKAVLTIRDFPLEAARAGKRYDFEILNREVMLLDEASARRARLTTGTEVLSLTTLHRFDDQPEALEERFINLSVVAQAREAAFDRDPPGTWLLRTVPWSEAEHVIRAINAGPTLARRLGIAAGAACLVVERRTFQGQRTITEARLYYPGEQHRLVGHFTSTGAPAAHRPSHD